MDGWEDVGVPQTSITVAGVDGVGNGSLFAVGFLRRGSKQGYGVGLWRVIIGFVPTWMKVQEVSVSIGTPTSKFGDWHGGPTVSGLIP